MCYSSHFRKFVCFSFFLPFTGLLGALVFAAGPALGAPGGELDASFGDHGRVTLEVGDSANFAHDVAQQADGKLLVAGTIGAGNGPFDFAVVRLNANGSLDSSFGNGGVAVVNDAGFALSIAVQPDGKIVVAGGQNDLVLARLNADGTPDANFGANGIVVRDLGGEEEGISAITLLLTGQIVVTGTTDVNGDLDVVIARFTPLGGVDATFGTGPLSGATVVDSIDNHDFGSAMVRQGDGKLVVCGTSQRDEVARLLAVRVHGNGALDPGFGTGGIARVNLGTQVQSGSACVAMPDGTTVLAGYGGIGSDIDLGLARLSAGGVLDTTFADNGIALIDVGGSEFASDILRLGDGSLGVTGHIAVTEHLSDLFIARLDPDSGALDPGFGNDGVTIVDFGDPVESSATEGYELIQQADGKLVAVGTRFAVDFDSINRMAIARVDPAGTGHAGVAGFVAPSVSVDETAAEVSVNVRRTGGSTGNLSVDYTTANGTAVEPGDYTETSGTLTWLDGETDAQTIDVPINDDTLDEAGTNGEWFTVQLANSSAGLAATTEVVFIIDDDTVVEPPPASGGGGGGTMTGSDLWVLLLLAAAISTGRKRNSPGAVGTRHGPK